MDIFKMIRELLGGGQKPQQVQPQPQRAQGMTRQQIDFPGHTNYGVPQDNMIDTPNGYITAEQYNALPQPQQQSLQRQTEDSGLVDTPQGRMPLSSVNPGQQWQNPDNGFSPNGYKQIQNNFRFSPRPQPKSIQFEDLLKNLRF